jgi:beta-glucosidase
MQVYVGDRSGVLQMPETELRAFSKVHLETGASQRIELPIARADLEHFHPDAGWVFAGGSMQVSVGSSSRDIRLQTNVEGPGHPVEILLTVWAQLRDWMTHPVVGPARARVGDQLSDPVSQDSALIFPLISVTQFPVFPVSAEEAQELLNRS